MPSAPSRPTTATWRRPSSGCGRRAWPRRPSATSGRTPQGAVALFVDGNVGAIVELKCETDFVASSEHFKQLANDLAALVALDGEAAVEQRAKELEDLRITLKEKIELGDVVRIEARRRRRARVLPPRAGRPGRQRRARRSWPAARRSWPTTSPSTSPSPGRSTWRQDDVPGRRRGEGAGDARRPQPQRGQARAGPARRSSRVACRASSRTSPSSSSPTPRTTSSTISELLGGATIVRYAQVEIG